MAPEIDASSPARATGATTNGTVTVTTASFNPPAALLVATVQLNARPNGATGAMSNNGAALTWTTVAERSKADASAQNAFAAIYVAPLSAGRTGMTVTFTGTSSVGTPTELNSPSLKLYVVVNAATTVGGSAEGSATSASVTTTGFTAVEETSLGFVSASEWDDFATPTSSDLTADVLNNGTLAGVSGYKRLGAAGLSATFNLASTTTSPQWNWVAAEIKPTARVFDSLRVPPRIVLLP